MKWRTSTKQTYTCMRARYCWVSCWFGCGGSVVALFLCWFSYCGYSLNNFRNIFPALAAIVRADLASRRKALTHFVVVALNSCAAFLIVEIAFVGLLIVQRKTERARQRSRTSRNAIPTQRNKVYANERACSFILCQNVLRDAVFWTEVGKISLFSSCVVSCATSTLCVESARVSVFVAQNPLMCAVLADGR